MAVPAKTREVFEYLKQCAREMRIVQYGEISAHVGLPAVGVGPRLSYIRDYICRSRGLPWLSIIAVSVNGWRPRTSYMPDGISIESDRDEKRLWRGMVLQVFAYDWDRVEFDG